MKKKQYLILVLLVLVLSAKSQTPNTFAITFENDNWKKYISFDNPGDTNIWTIGKPKGIFFNKAWEGTNALFTDKSKSSPFPYKSSFTITVPLDSLTTPENGYVGTMGFYYKSNLQKNDSVAIILKEKNGGKFDLLSRIWFIQNHWKYKRIVKNDTFIKDFPPFFDSISNWIVAEFKFDYYSTGKLKDTFQLEFVLFSNSNDTSLEGLMIDSFYTNFSIVGVKENFVKDYFYIFPNPANKFIQITTAKTGLKQINFVDLYGKLNKRCTFNTLGIHTIDISDLINGVYILKITDETGSFYEKIIINN